MPDNNSTEITSPEDTESVERPQDNVGNEDLELHTQESRILSLEFPLVNQDAISLDENESKEYLGFIRRVMHVFDDPMPMSAFLNEEEKQRFKALEQQVAPRTKELADMLETRKIIVDGQAVDVTSENLLPYGYKLNSEGNVVVATNEDVIPRGYFIIPTKEDDGESFRIMPRELVSKRDLSKEGYTRNKMGEVYKFVEGS